MIYRNAQEVRSPIDELFDLKVRILGDAFAQRIEDAQRWSHSASGDGRT
jgi:hypothetical protein